MNCLLLAFLPASDAYSQRVYASSQTNGVTGLLCLACNVDNPTNSVGSGNLDDYAQFNVTVGLAASVYQVLNFPAVNPNQGCDSLVIGIGSSNDVLAANLLGGVTVSTYNGNNTTPLETFPASTSLLRLLAGSQRGEIVLRPTQRFDRVRITLNGGLLGALSNFRLYYAYRNQVQLTPPNITTGSSISTCSGSPVTLQASTTTPGAVISWYDAPTGGNQLPTPGNPQGTSISVSPTATTTYYAQVSLDNCTNTTRSAITVNVNPLPAAPVIAVTNQVICGGQQATFSVSAPVAGVTYRWYTVPSGGTEVGTGTSFTTPTLSSTTVYYAEAVQIATGCASTSRVPVTATVNPTPAAPTITPTSITIQGGSTAAFSVQNPDPSATYTWYNLSTGGTALATGTSFTTPALFATTSYYVEARSNQGCASLTRTQVTANVNVQNNVPCSFATQQVSPVINGVCLLCGVSDPTLAVDTDTSSASTIFATVGALGSSGQLLQFPNNYAATDSIVLVLETPGTLLALSALSSITVTTYSGTTSNNDTRGLNAGLINLQLISGTNKYRVSFVAGNNFNGVLVSINGLLSALPQLRVYYAAVTVPQAVPTSASLNICTGSSATLTVTAPASATVNWYDAPAGGNLVVGNTTTYTTPVLTASRTYYVATGKYGCENGLRVPVIVTVNTPPATPTVNTSNLTACAGDSVTFVANGPAGATFYWYTAATGGSPIDSGVTFTTPGLSATTMFYVEAANNSCVSAARFAVTATVNDAPASVTELHQWLTLYWDKPPASRHRQPHRT
ncbi:hypothetical protein MKQ70_26335 [Chitinophaga sedimenti]|uniref:immunoglobulin domain-containing protein n=1 Tax=Chitinophaga sedimenti TaxID=2033606 RepID=UPI002003AFCE|nr:hypothetical protein [Chitinophaga sedimenti]MCK7558329.1 hypothetical protein [Chitinophaga sedimenti]